MSKKIILKKDKERPLLRNHPWIFSGAIHKMDKGVRDGDRVDIKDFQGQYLATGHYQNGSIAIRVISQEPIGSIDVFWVQKIQNAVDYRKAIGLWEHPDTNCFRLVHAEGDGLPGLIIDIYDKVAVVQCHSIGMYKSISSISQALQQVFENALESIFIKSTSTLPSKFALEISDDYVFGDTSSCPCIVKENGLSFEVNWETGQKTGFFLDQRDNRNNIIRYCAGKKVLNAFSYSGGFSVYALKGGAKEVHSLDISSTAMELADKNIRLNQFEGMHQCITEDVMDYLRDTSASYDVMIVDPPAFAKSIKKRHNAVQAYKRLNILAMKRMHSGGILSTYSCSQVVDKPLFYNTIKAAAIEVGKKVRVIRHLSQPADHPVSLFHDEGSYLKGLDLYVE